MDTGVKRATLLPLPIVVDTREPHDLTQILRFLVGADVPFRKEFLESGDYLLMDRAGETLAVERKTVSDFLGSMADGRLESQLERMASDYDHRLLVIQGRYKRDGTTGKIHIGQRGTGWHYTAMQMKLLAVQGRYEARVLWVADEREFADVLRALHNQGEEGHFRV